MSLDKVINLRVDSMDWEHPCREQLIFRWGDSIRVARMIRLRLVFQLSRTRMSFCQPPSSRARIAVDEFIPAGTHARERIDTSYRGVQSICKADHELIPYANACTECGTSALPTRLPSANPLFNTFCISQILFRNEY